MPNSTFVLLVGPSGVGKDTLLAKLLERIPSAVKMLSTTSRSPRPTETNGKDYHFISEQEFEARIGAGAFLEAKRYSENWYGTELVPLERLLKKYSIVLKIVEIQGAREIKRKMPEALTIFIGPGNFADLERRQKSRPGANAADVQRRLKTAEIELAAAGEFDHQVINVDAHLEDCVDDIVEILRPFITTA